MAETMIRPDGTPHHGQMDGWEDHDGCPLSIVVSRSVYVKEFERRLTLPWARLIVDHVETSDKSRAAVWSAVIPHEGATARRSESVSHVSALVYDFDGTATWESVVDVLTVFRYRFWAYTTFSHTEDTHKFRVVLGLDEAIPAAEYAEAWRAVRDAMGWTLDEQCKDLFRQFYVPSCPPGSSPWQAWGDGANIAWRRIVEHDRETRPKPTPVQQAIQAARSYAVQRQIDASEIGAEATRRAFADGLDSINPDAAYHDWIRLGAIAKEIGMESKWIEWCQRGTKYVAGEPERKLKSFRR